MAIGKSRQDVSGKGFLGWLEKTFASNFSFLEKLDEISDRYVDNANLFSIEDP